MGMVLRIACEADFGTLCVPILRMIYTEYVLPGTTYITYQVHNIYMYTAVAYGSQRRITSLGGGN